MTHRTTLTHVPCDYSDLNINTPIWQRINYSIPFAIIAAFSVHEGVYQSALDTNSTHMCGCTVNYWKKPHDVAALCCV